MRPGHVHESITSGERMHRWLPVLLVAAIAALGCDRAPARPPAVAVVEPVADERLAAAIEQAFERDAVLASQPIRVSVTHGRVQLSGSVADLRAKQRAEHSVATFKGASALDSGIEVTGPERRDEEIAKDVNDTIRKDPATRAADAHATSSGAVVTIRGSAASASQREALSDAASAVPGVRRVVVAVDLPRANRRDEEIAADVRNRLDEDARLDATRVLDVVHGRAVSLSGLVGSLFQHDAAVADAWVPGVTDVEAYGLRVDWGDNHRAGSTAARPSPCDCSPPR
ncbi:MAG TPA: BON domain-containing protein [Polyangiaceae bacterium]|jgi:osmotically-inducible protein OsmY